MKNYTFRPVNEKDYPFIQLMFIEVAAVSDPHLAVDSYMSVHDFQRNIIGIVVENQKHTPLGAVWLQRTSDTPTLWIGIIPEYRQKGIGSNLLIKFYTVLLDTGINDICLHVDSQNNQAIYIYKKHGWIIENDKSSEFITMKKKIL